MCLFSLTVWEEHPYIGGQQLRDWGRTMRRRRGTRRSLVWACRAGAQFSGAVGPQGPSQGEPCGEGNCCLHAHSGLGAHSWKGQGVGAGGRLGAQPGGGGGEEGRVGVRLRGVAGSSGGGHDGERGLSEAVRGRMYVPQGLWEAWGLLWGWGSGVLRWWLGWQPRDRDQTMRKMRRRCWQRFGQAQVGRWSAEPQGWWPGNTSLCVLWACWRSGSAGRTPRRDRASPQCGCGGGASCWAGWWSSSHKSHRWKASLLHRFTNKSWMCEDDILYQSKRVATTQRKYDASKSNPVLLKGMVTKLIKALWMTKLTFPFNHSLFRRQQFPFKNANKLPSWIVGLCCQPTHSTGSYYNSHFEERRCEIEQQQLRWNAALINLPPWSHWMCLPPPTQPSINRMLKGSVNALFWHGECEAPPNQLNIKRWQLMCPFCVTVTFCTHRKPWGICVQWTKLGEFVLNMCADYYRAWLGVSPPVWG